MIKLLNNKNEETSRKIHFLFQASYRVEAQILKAVDFPPLKRTLEDYLTSDTSFYGLFEGKTVAAIVEVSADKTTTHINSLVVHPNHFRKGYGNKLMEFVLKTYDSEIFTVETGVDNGPATQLYFKLGFIEMGQYDTAVGIRKIKLKKS